MPGLPRKYAKMGFKKGWRAYRASKKSRVSMGAAKRPKKRVKRATHARRKTSTNRPTLRRTTTKRRSATTMAKRKTRRRVRRVRLGATRAVRRRSTGTAIAQDFMASLPIAGGMVGGFAAVKALPVIKNQNAWLQAGVQLIGGFLVRRVSRDKMMKRLAHGITISAGLTALNEVLPARFQILSGAGTMGNRRLSPAEYRRTLGIPTSLGIPHKLDRTMGSTVREKFQSNYSYN